MTTTAMEVVGADLSNWAPGTRFFSASDGRHFVIDADLDEHPEDGNVRLVRRPTVVLYTTETAWPTDLTPDFVFDPGTTHEEAVALAGFELTEGGL